MTKSSDAIAAIEAGKPDTEINRLCVLAFGWKKRDAGFVRPFWVNKLGRNAMWFPPDYTTSLDAIKAEMPDGWYMSASYHRDRVLEPETGAWTSEVDQYDENGIHGLARGDAPTEYLARLLALLKAMAAQNAGS